MSKNEYMPPKWLFTVLLLVLGGWIFIRLQQLLTLLFLGYLIAYLADPVLDYFETKGLGRRLGFAILCVVSLLVFSVLAITVGPTIIREISQLFENFPTYLSKAQETLAPQIEMVRERISFLKSGHSFNEVFGDGSSLSSLPIREAIKGLSSAAWRGYSFTMAIVNLAILPFIVYYLAIDFDAFHRQFLKLVPPKKRDSVIDVVADIDSLTSKYFRGQLFVASILFVLYAIGLAIIGVELWLPLALLSGFGHLIPYLGFAIGIVLSTVMALVTFGTFLPVLAVWGVFVVVQSLEGVVITPRVLGDSVQLPPLVVMLAIIAGGTLFGLLGIFLAIPGACAIRVIGGRFLPQQT